MKILIAYYSRTGTTRKAAESLAQKLGAEIKEIKDTVDRGGALGYLKSGRDAMQRKLTQLQPFGKNVAEYDLVIVGTPIWGWNMSAPVRTFLTEQKNNFKAMAFFCTMGGSHGKTFQEMEEVSGKKPLATLALLTKEVVKNEFEAKLAAFADQLG